MAADGSAKTRERDEDYVIINGEKFKRETINFADLVIQEFQQKPFVNYKYLVQKYGIKKQQVFSIFYFARKRGVELRPGRKPWTRKNGNAKKTSSGV